MVFATAFLVVELKVIIPFSLPSRFNSLTVEPLAFNSSRKISPTPTISSFNVFFCNAITVIRYCREFTYSLGVSFQSTSFFDSELYPTVTWYDACFHNVAAAHQLQVKVHAISRELSLQSRKCDDSDTVGIRLICFRVVCSLLLSNHIQSLVVERQHPQEIEICVSNGDFLRP